MLNDEGNLEFNPLYCVPHIGVVADREDPEKLGRVRVIIPGVYPIPSPWAFPFGTLGGGSGQRGAFFVPEKGADVMVFFVLGDPERPMYCSAHWGRTEAPTVLDGVSQNDTPDIRTIEGKNFTITMDDRSSPQLIIQDKNNTEGVFRIADGKVYAGDENATEPFVLGSQWKTGMEQLFDQLVLITHTTAVGPTSPPLNAAAFTAQKALLSAKLSSIIFGK